MPILKVFISHQQRDAEAAKLAYDVLNRHPSVIPYLDVLDPRLALTGDDLADYIIAKLSDSTHLLAVVSENTKTSWWVPFEIGIATDRQYPLSTYAAGWCELPEYLKKWPYLRSESDLQRYAETAVADPRVATKRFQEFSLSERSAYTRTFHRELRRALGQ